MLVLFEDFLPINQGPVLVEDIHLPSPLKPKVPSGQSDAMSIGLLVTDTAKRITRIRSHHCTALFSMSVQAYRNGCLSCLSFPLSFLFHHPKLGDNPTVGRPRSQYDLRQHLGSSEVAPSKLMM